MKTSYDYYTKTLKVLNQGLPREVFISRQKQEDLYEFEASLVYTVSSRKSWLCRDCLKSKKKNPPPLQPTNNPSQATKQN